ncbi:hypothetical protein ACU635_05080 [[Actinomadura] parvosata]|uniref:hypothetical protein n=1 Tax=[Actinomadura] parvosata TaxID=1955412 RepID=UPI00406CE4C0
MVNTLEGKEHAAPDEPPEGPAAGDSAYAAPLTAGVWPGVLPGLPFSPPPAGLHPNRDHRIKLWLDEQIWGHRLWDSQSPWLIFLEFLNVAEACERRGKLLTDEAPYPLIYRPRRRMFLRNILFYSDDIDRVAEKHGDSRRAWDEWLMRIQDTAIGIPRPDFNYLRSRFYSYTDFAEVVHLLRATAVERQSNKRWTSRFVFPFGAHALYIDLNATPSGLSREYINFGRSGELLYLMLARSSSRDQLAPYVREIVSGHEKWDRLVAALQPEDDDDDQERSGNSCYLPYLRHQIFDGLAEDWLRLFNLELPGFDAYPHLVTLGALHLLRYHLSVASTWTGGDGKPYLVCEIIAPKKTLVREVSLRTYGQNDSLSARAVEQFIERIRSSAAWIQAVSSGEFAQCQEVLSEAISWDDSKNSSDPDAVLANLKIEALKGHQRHAAQVHRTYGREIGLVSRRGTNRFRYAPTDQLIKTLLFATVTHRMEFGEFLHKLFEKYQLVIGAREAEQVLPADEFDSSAFQDNARRLEQRLVSLGLLRRLSDACAYVENPYRKAEA